MLDRRNFSLGLAASAALLGAGCGGASDSPAKSISKVGLQTYTLRYAFDENPEATLKMIKNAGYDYVELNGGNFQKVDSVDLKAMLESVGLPAPATHISLESLSQDFDQLTAVSKLLGIKYLVVPYVAENARALDDWKAHAALMNEAGSKLADQGLTLAYHNHQFEFDDLGGGTTAMDILLGDCAPENMCFEIDLFWASLADADIKGLFRKNPGRFKLCHIKDMGPNKSDFVGASYEDLTTNLMKNVGEGTIPFEDYFALNDISGLEYFIAEHDNPAKPYDAAIKSSLEAVRGFRF